MLNYAELELRLSRRGGASYIVELQFIPPGTDAPTNPDPGQVTFDFDGLSAALNDIPAYGALLTENFFADKKILAAFEQARTTADVVKAPLRVRLLIETSEADLHALRWETLQDPRNGAPLATSDRTLFSRYLLSPDWRPVHLRSSGRLRALVVIANPRELENYAPEDGRLQAVDVQAEMELARSGLEPIPVTVLAERGQASLNNISRHLRERERYDILYLVCHGAFVRGQPRLYLENDQGDVHVVDGRELEWELARLREPPALVVLASCQSAGSGTTGALAAVGPALARAGVPAVVAMQGKISVETSQNFISRFFKELGADGQLDRAVSVARGEVKNYQDYWMPVLFTRLMSGGIWSVAEHVFERWDGLIRNLREGRCTPIVGPGLIEFLLGSPRDVAQRWADTYRYPMAPHDRANLAQVSQYLAIQNGPEFPRSELEEYLKQEMQERYADQLPDRLREPDAKLAELLTEVGQQRREQDETEPHRVLANLPIPIYITTNPDDLLAGALHAADKAPEVVLCPWDDELDWPESIFDREPDYQPTAQRPLVYHLFGRIEERETVVLTEDDYFRYLTGVTKLTATNTPVTRGAEASSGDIPPVVVRAWSDNALLFLGFQMDDWNFRVLFQSIMSSEIQQRRSRRKGRVHVAVQIDPEQGQSLDPRRARRYLEDYFQDADITIYWGSTEQFIKDLWREWQNRQ